MLDVTVYMVDPDGDLTSKDFNDVSYVSFVNDKSYGGPALIVPTKDAPQARCHPGETVLYINPNIVPVFEITRHGS